MRPHLVLIVCAVVVIISVFVFVRFLIRRRKRLARWAMYAEMARVNRATRAALASSMGIPESELYEMKKAAEAGDGEAQNALGECYSTANPPDFGEAVKWFRVAADQGFAQAQHNLALSYESGEGLAKNQKEAVKWYRKAAGQGVPEAQYNLAMKYLRGEGTAADTERGLSLLQDAAQQNLKEAKAALRALSPPKPDPAQPQATAKKRPRG